MLPVLVSVPHGGTETPPEIADRVCITPEDLFDDSDACARDIYDVGNEVAHFQAAEIARAFVDLNRAPDDLPPANPDGVVKTATCYDRPIYCPGKELTPELTQTLLDRYYFPYHRRLEEASAGPGIRLALDCHSMAPEPPNVAPDRDRPRPLFCLSNDNGRTCPDDLMQRLAGAIVAAFEIDRSDVRVNDPFRGGYIARSHGAGPLPWVQVEMNRSLYLAPPWFDRDTLAVDPSRLRGLRDSFLTAIQDVAQDL